MNQLSSLSMARLKDGGKRPKPLLYLLLLPRNSLILHLGIDLSKDPNILH